MIVSVDFKGVRGAAYSKLAQVLILKEVRSGEREIVKERLPEAKTAQGERGASRALHNQSVSLLYNNKKSSEKWKWINGTSRLSSGSQWLVQQPTFPVSVNQEMARCLRKKCIWT